MRPGSLMALAILFQCLAAGCVEETERSGEPGLRQPDAPDPAKGEATPPRARLPQIEESMFSLNDCSWGSYWSDLPRTLVDLPPPTPWHSDYPLLTVVYDVMVCQRIGWPPLERGPVSIVWESTHITADPPDCGVDESGLLRFVHQVYTDDAAFGLQLASAMGVPVYNASIKLDPSMFGSTSVSVASWDVPGHGASRISLSPPYDPFDPQTADMRHFMLAYNGTHTARLLLEGTLGQRSPIAHDGVGEFADPTVMMGAPSQTVIFSGVVDFDYEATGQLTTWEGLGCGA